MRSASAGGRSSTSSRGHMQLHARRALMAAGLAASLLAGSGLLSPVVRADGERRSVTVIDAPAGDMLKARMDDGTLETIRLIGLDAPEPGAPGRPAGCFADEAKARTGSLANGQQAELEL